MAEQKKKSQAEKAAASGKGGKRKNAASGNRDSGKTTVTAYAPNGVKGELIVRVK